MSETLTPEVAVEESAPQKKDIHEVDISYSPEEIVEKLKYYQLKLGHVYTKLTVDKETLGQLQKDIEADSYLAQLCESLLNWQPSQNTEHFTADINQLLYCWVNAIDEGAEIDTVLGILNCFKLSSTFKLSNATNFHLFLHRLVVESLQKYQKTTLDYLLNYDDDIQLPNTNQIVSNLETIINNANGEKITAVLALHFQTSNNNFLLPKLVAINLNKLLAEMLGNIVGDDAQIYFSGDSQFDILMPKIASKTQLELITIKIFGAFEEMVFINKQSILVKPFIGNAHTYSNKVDAEELYQNAKLALEQAILKKKYHVTYSEELEESIGKQIILESNVLDAFDSNNLEMHCQPIVDCKTNKCVGAELLLRWSSKFGTNINPALIVDTLNNAGKGKLFTRWLVNSACRYLHELNTKHELADLYLTINLRAEDLYDTELPSLFSNALSLWKLTSENLILEITESGILEQNDATSNVINSLSDMGFKFALDDFGTGFSSLTRLRTLPIDLIKIDQSFVRNIHSSKEDYKIVQSISMLAKSLGKEVLVEGVENEASLSLIKKLKIQKCQGYYFSKPMPYEKFISWAKTY